MTNDNNFTTSVANLAAAAVAANPKLTVAEAVRQASESLRQTIRTVLSAREVAASITAQYIVCFEDRTRHVMLRRYIKRKWGLSPEQYRAKWGLPDDYPMTAPAYSKKRGNIAKENNFGKK